MRTGAVVLLSLMATTVATTALAEDAVAGRTHILVSSPQNAFWVPLDGSPSQQIYPGHGVATSVATDGERFLVANGGRSISLYDEGALQPLTTISLDAESQTRGFATWDGNRYLVTWGSTEGNVRIAVLNREGALIRTVTLDAVAEVDGLAANGDRILLLEQRNRPADAPTVRRLRAFLLNADFTIQTVTLLGEIQEPFVVDPATFQHAASAIPFGDGFYVAWHQGELSFGGDRAASRVFGTRITADGAAIDVRQRIEGGASIVEGRTLLAGVPEAFDTDLVNTGGYVIAVNKRASVEAAKAPLAGTFIAPDGLTLGTRPLADVELSEDRRTQLEAVRLRDGRTVAVSVVDFDVELISLDLTPPKLPRRRAVR